jgi:hypothetical protein
MRKEDDCYEEKLLTQEIDDLRNTQFSNWQMNPGVASMRFSGSS